MKVSLSADALADAEQVIDWYVDHLAGSAAEDFHIELGKSLDRIGYEPGIGTPGPAATRVLPLHRFPYSLVYRVAGDDLRVIAVAGQRRKPGFWRGRR